MNYLTNVPPQDYTIITNPPWLTEESDPLFTSWTNTFGPASTNWVLGLGFLTNVPPQDYTIITNAPWLTRTGASYHFVTNSAQLAAVAALTGSATISHKPHGRARGSRHL